MPALTGYAPPGNALMNQYPYGNAIGSQATPLDNYYGVGGTTGNKTTNKDLPDWLRKLGMKGDAYAGGMLKPQIRYGFWYKNGKINFADGTSYAAKKNKDGSFAYTDSTGKAQSYSPTDEQNAYNQKYHASTSNQSFLDKASNAVKFELDHGAQIIKGVWDHPQQAIFGVDPIGTKIGNAVTGDNATAQVDQLGGALPGRYADYTARTGNATGYAKPLQGVAHVIAGLYGAAGAGHGLGQLAQGAGNALGVGGGSTGEGLGIFSNGGQAGLAGVGGGNAGALAASGGIAGGAGVGGTTAGALGGFSGAANSVSGVGGGSAAGGNMGWDWGQLINTGATLLGGALQARGARDAANASAAGSEAAIAESRRQYDQSRADQMPWLMAGAGALGRLQDPNANFAASPDYAFRRDEGTRDIGNSFSARGGAQSGNALRALDQFNSNLASGEFGNWWNRQAGLAGVGQTSAQNLGSLGANSATNIGNALQNGANARASGVEGQTNAYTGTIADLLANYNRNRRPVGYGG